jgi:hypothetical protein
MKTNRTIPVLLLLSLAVACGPTARQKALQTTLTTLNTSRDAFVAWDAEHQTTIVKQAPSLEKGQETLTFYRAQREKVILGFSAAYAAVAAAAINTDDPNALAQAITSIKTVYDAVEGFLHGGGNP